MTPSSVGSSCANGPGDWDQRDETNEVERLVAMTMAPTNPARNRTTTPHIQNIMNSHHWDASQIGSSPQADEAFISSRTRAAPVSSPGSSHVQASHVRTDLAFDRDRETMSKVSPSNDGGFRRDR